MSETSQEIRDFFEGLQDHDFTENIPKRKAINLETGNRTEESYAYDHGDIDIGD